jgi:Fe-Mn family superoxide dismutase
MPHKLIELPYPHDALEPWIDARTMEIHHGKHHAAYVANLNKALEGQAGLVEKPLEALLSDLNAVPEAIRTAVRNNGGGVYNHNIFWEIMKKGGGGEPKGDLAKAIQSAFGSFADFRSKLSSAALTRFGSGWAWLNWKGGKLVVESTANQESPVSEGASPLLTLDVWEHAYYLKYQNRRADYIEAWWNTVNWDKVAEKYDRARKE